MHAAKRSRSIVMVFFCTLLGAAAQVFFKLGSTTLGAGGIMGVITNVPVMAGYCLLGLSMGILTLALRNGELSLLYPVISLTYLWVTVLSVIIFHEALNPFKVAGLALIIIGVAVLGRDGRKS